MRISDRIKQGTHIAEGFFYSVFKNQEVEAFAQARASVCKDKCSPLPITLGELSCPQCHCFIGPKTRVKNEKCPKGYWK